MSSRTTMSVKARLGRVSACMESIEWVGRRGVKRAWAECPRSDWMLWLLHRCASTREQRQESARASVAVVRPAVAIFEARRPGDDRVRVCVDVLERWSRGEATDDELCAARRGATAAAHAAHATAAYATAAHAAYATAAYATAATAAAATATYATAAAAAATATATADTAAAADTAAWRAARTEAFADGADRIRAVFPEPPLWVLEATS